MIPTIEIKQGESFAEGGSWTDDATGAAIDLTGWSATCQVRDADGTEIGTLTVAIDAGAGGTFLLSQTAANTAVWPAGSYLADLRFLSPASAVVPSPTFRVKVLGRITAP